MASLEPITPTNVPQAGMTALEREGRDAWIPWGLAAFGFVATLTGLAILGARLTDPPSLFLALAGATLLLGLERLFAVSKALVRTQLAAALVDEGGGVGGSARELREERTRVLKAIKELEFDFAVGKLETADYEQIVGAYKLRAIELGRALQGPAAAAKRVPQHDVPPADHGVAPALREQPRVPVLEGESP
jgi:hypothetical protein